MNDIGFDAVDMVRRIVRSAATASLGTLAPDGGPFVTFVTVTTDIDGAPILLLSGLAAHSRHLARDGRVSLLMQVPAGEGDDPLTGVRATVIGHLLPIARDEAGHERLLARFLARHPRAEGYASFGDFAVYRMTVDGIHLVAGFGRIARLTAADVLVPSAIAEVFAAAEPSLLREIYWDTGGHRLVAVDPDGVDVMDEGVRRLSFRRRAEDLGDVAALLAELG